MQWLLYPGRPAGSCSVSGVLQKLLEPNPFTECRTPAIKNAVSGHLPVSQCLQENPALPQLAYLYNEGNTVVSNLWILQELKDMIHVKLLARAWHKFSKNVHCYFYCCYLLMSGVGLQMCHPYRFVSVKKGDANRGSQGTPRCSLENILDSNLDRVRRVWNTELYVPCKRTLSTFLVDFHAFFFWGILFPLLNSKRAGYTK